ncbi:unnamed protein product [Sphagnum balticum]
MQVGKGVLRYVSQEVKDLYNLVENEFHPLDLAAKVSQVYQTMKISNLTNMIGFFDFSVVEKIAVDAVKYTFVQVKIDHLKGIVGFGSQDLESEKMKNHLTILVKRFNKAIGMMQPCTLERPYRQNQPFSELQVIVEEHKKLLARKEAIEQSQKQHETDLVEKKRLICMLEDKSLFQQQVVGRREGEFERLKCLCEERLAEECSLRSQEGEVCCKKEYFKRQEEARLLKIQGEEEARKLEALSHESKHGPELEADSAPPPPSDRYQPPWSREPEVPQSRPGAYEPPRVGSRGDTYAPRGGGRYDGARCNDGPPLCPVRPFPVGRLSEDRWGAVGSSGVDLIMNVVAGIMRDQTFEGEVPATLHLHNSLRDRLLS